MIGFSWIALFKALRFELYCMFGLMNLIFIYCSDKLFWKMVIVEIVPRSKRFYVLCNEKKKRRICW